MPKKTKGKANDPLAMPDEKVKWAKPAPPGVIDHEPDDLEEEMILDSPPGRHHGHHREHDDEDDEDTAHKSKKEKKDKKEKKKKKRKHDDDDSDDDDDEEEEDNAGILADLARQLEEAKRQKEAILRQAQEKEEAAAVGGERAAEIKRVVKGFDESELKFPRKQLHKLITHWSFDIVIGIVICLNGVTIMVETSTKSLQPLACDEDCNCTIENAGCHLPPHWVFLMEWMFFVVYILELSARLIVFGPAVLGSHWIKFDATLVFIAVTDKIIRVILPDNEVLKKMMLFRMLRLLRLARAVRLMVQFQTLWQLVQGLMSSVMTLSWTFLLLFILIYVFAIFGMNFITVDLQLPLDHPYNVAAYDNFRELPDAMLMLLQFFSWDSISSVYRPLIQHRFGLFFYFMSVLLLLSIALMNLVTAIMVEGSLSQAASDKDNQKVLLAAKQQKQMEQLKVMFREMDDDGSGELSMEEIDAAPAEVRDQLVEIAGTEDIDSLFEMLDYDGGGTVGTDEFCDGVMKANNSDKPMEISRLLKQCSDILQNSREAVTLLRGEEWTGSSADGDDDSKDNQDNQDNQDNKPRKQETPVKKNKNPRLDKLEARMNNMDETIKDMEGDVQQLVQTMTRFLSMNHGSKTASNGMKKAVAVAVLKGPAQH